jgi:beta-glucosidase
MRNHAMTEIRRAGSAGFVRTIGAPALAMAMVATVAAAADAPPPYRDPSRPVEQRVDDLLARMTLEEKLSQLNNDSKAIPRLGIASYNVWNEALHGVARNGIATVYPQAIAMAATFDTQLIQDMGEAVASEARAKHELAVQLGRSRLYQGLTFFSPNINIFRDPRWGRGQETYGEDPYLTGKIAVAYISGLQGNDPAHLRVGATAKHFAVHSGPELLRHGFDARPSAHDLEDTYLPAFRAAVTEGHVASVMCVYNAVDGVPGCANTYLLRKTLRTDWQFKGFVVSDCNAVNDIYSGHHYVASEAAAAAAALKAGVDNECTVKTGSHEEDYAKYGDAIREGLLSAADVDGALRRVLRARFLLGLFDPVDSPRADAPAQVDSDANRQLARQVARESLVLLKNDGVLPLTSVPDRIAVVGPLADSQRVLEGNYNGTPSKVTTLLAGLRQQFPAAQILYAPGTEEFLREELLVPSTVLSTDSGQPGLKLDYFRDADRSGPAAVTRVDPQVNLRNTGDGGDYFARWSGWLTPDESGEYRVAVLGEANRIYLDGRLLVDTLSAGPPQPGSAEVVLERGHRYAIRVDNSPSLTRECRLVWVRHDRNALQKAVAAAQQADLVIAAVGITADLEGEESALEIPGFKGGDRTTLDLPAEEQTLLESVKSPGKPLVVVLMSGSGLGVRWARDNANALLQAWYPGEEGGKAIAETLAGASNPAGRLPVTFYASTDQLPDFADYSMKQRTYRYFTGQPLFGFGFGLSYSRFEYTNLTLSSRTLQAGQPLQVRVGVKNAGEQDGDEVVQLYLSIPGAAGAPRRALRAFKRVHLRHGESQLVQLSLAPRELSHVDASGAHVISAGRYDISVGGGQPDSGLAAVKQSFVMDGQQQLPR